MKKLRVFAIIICIALSLTFIGCNSLQNKAPLTYNKKYYNPDKTESVDGELVGTYYIFYKDGTGEFNTNGNRGVLKFTYFLTDETVHFYFLGDTANKSEWYWVKDGVIFRETSVAVNYIREDKLEQLNHN